MPRPRFDALVGFNRSQNGLFYGAPRLSLEMPSTAVLTAGSPLLFFTFILPIIAGGYRFCCERITFETLGSVAGTVAAATFDLLNPAAVSLLTAPIALVGLTAVDLKLATAGPLAATAVQNSISSPTLVMNQTVNSANAGFIAATVDLALLP